MATETKYRADHAGDWGIADDTSSSAYQTETLALSDGTKLFFRSWHASDPQAPAWLPGEVAQMRDLAALTDGPKGTLLSRTPLAWSFLPDPHDTGLARGWARHPDRCYLQITGVYGFGVEESRSRGEETASRPDGKPAREKSEVVSGKPTAKGQ